MNYILMLKKIALAGALSLAMTGVHAAEKLKMATIAPGTSAYLTMTTFANLVNQNQDKYEFTVDATGAATKHQIEVAKGKLDYCMTSGSIYHFLKTGKAMYKKTKDSAKLAENLRLVMWFPYGQYHFIVHEDSGIKTLADLKGKKVAFGMELPQLISDLKRQMRANKQRPGAKIRRVTVGKRKTSSGAKFVTAKGS